MQDYGLYLQRQVEEYEDRMARREWAIDAEKEDLLEDRERMADLIFKACEDDKVYGSLVNAIAEMASEYYHKGRRTDAERRQGIVEAFVSITGMLEQLAEQTAAEAYDGRH